MQTYLVVRSIRLKENGSPFNGNSKMGGLKIFSIKLLKEEIWEVFKEKIIGWVLRQTRVKWSCDVWKVYDKQSEDVA